MELPVAIALAVAGALLTVALCDLTGGIARAKGRSYWLFFAFGLLLWFPALLVALALPTPDGLPGAQPPGRLEKAAGIAVAVLAALAVAAGLTAALAYAP